MAAPTLDGRLICACNCAYDINDSGVLPKDAANIYYPGAGFLNPPKTFVADIIHACFVGTTADGVVLGFRGTLRFNFQDYQTFHDWLNNIADDLVVPDWLPAGSSARVHRGFLRGFNDLCDLGAMDEVKTQLQTAGPDAKLLITGHSKGGALAILAGLRFWAEKQVSSSVVTFASPRVGDRAFADAYNNARIVSTRYEFQDDLVPHLPPRVGGLVGHLANTPLIGKLFSDIRIDDYESVGNLRFINWSNQIESDSLVLEYQRDLYLVGIILRRKFDRFISDHDIACRPQSAPGYMTTVCPVGVCA